MIVAGVLSDATTRHQGRVGAAQRRHGDEVEKLGNDEKERNAHCTRTPLLMGAFKNGIVRSYVSARSFTM